jgi:hypothetical protein
MTDSRHPWTYSCDFIRSLGPVSSQGVVLSRSDASQIREGIAKAINWSDKDLAIALSNAEQAKTQEDRIAETARMLAARNLNRRREDLLAQTYENYEAFIATVGYDDNDEADS